MIIIIIINQLTSSLLWTEFDSILLYNFGIFACIVDWILVEGHLKLIQLALSCIVCQVHQDTGHKMQIFHTQTVGLLNTPDEGDSIGNDDVHYGENLNNGPTMWQNMTIYVQPFGHNARMWWMDSNDETKRQVSYADHGEMTVWYLEC